MDSEQKSTEEKTTLRFDVVFMDYLSEYTEDKQEDILAQLILNDEILPKEDIYPQHVGGRLKNGEEYFIIEYINEHKDNPIYLDIEGITLDEYLDLMIEKQTLQTYEAGI
jgi:hypothetical protein